MALPVLTPEQRAQALAKAAVARKERAEIKGRLKKGELSLEIESIGKMKVIALIESLPGVGKVRAKSVMEKIGIAESRRIRGLGVHQIRELTAHFNLI
jgi:transposase